MTTDYCLNAVSEAIEKFGRPNIFTKDQEPPFSRVDFVRIICNENKIAFRMDGKGC